MGPYYCNDDDEQLTLVNIYDTKTDQEMGHMWQCPECGKRWVGFGDKGEYNGEPGGRVKADPERQKKIKARGRA